jgi:hypothetical protein
MALPTREEIAAAWRALAGGGEGEGWRSIAISGLSGNRLLAARHFPSNEEALLVCFASITLPQLGQLPQGSGFRVERTSPDDSGKWLALVRQPAGSLDLFSRMVADIVATLVMTNDLNDEPRIFQLFLGRIRAWQEFMKSGAEGLGPEAELGLVGELECMNKLLDTNLSVHLVLDGWMGPMDGLQDFVLGNGAIEVKSTMALQGFPATIMSLEQLDDAIRQPLFVCGCHFASASDGATLPERVAAMRERFSADASALSSFDNALLHARYSDAHSERYTRRFLASDVRFVLVDEDFPRLIPGNVPAGVRRARYEIDLDTVQDKRFFVDKIIEMMGVV